MKQENPPPLTTSPNGIKPPVIDLCSSDEEEDDNNGDDGASILVGEKRARSGATVNPTPAKRVAVEEEEGFGQSPEEERAIVVLPATPCNVVRPSPSSSSAVPSSCKQFWKAGDYEGTSGGHWEVSAGAKQTNKP